MPEPPEHVKRMGSKAERAYRDAFNGCLQRHDGKEKGENHNCFAIATKAANQAAGQDSE